MGLGKITRGFGKVGMALEALGYVLTAAKALGRAIKRAPDTRHTYEGDADKDRQADSRDER